MGMRHPSKSDWQVDASNLNVLEQPALQLSSISGCNTLMKTFSMLAVLSVVTTGCLDLNPSSYLFSEPPTECAAACIASAPTCKDASTLLAYRVRACDATVCQREAVAITCAHGCSAGACLGEPCAGVFCSSPPQPQCVGSILQTYSSTGTCESAQCNYELKSFGCARGCENAHCVDEPCVGKECASPPPSTCVGNSTLRVFVSLGTCNSEGSCQYAHVDNPCTNTCSDGKCVGDPCASELCDTPPSATCRSATVVYLPDTRGTCEAGVCSYNWSEQSCSTEQQCLAGRCVPGGGSGTTDLTWTPTELNFENVNPGEFKIMEVVFQNHTSIPVVLTQVTSTNPADFYHSVPAGSDDTQFTVPGGLVPTPMKIVCKPSKFGVLTGTLTFVTNQPQTPTGTITLNCTGGGPRIRVSPRPTLSFGRVGFFPGNTTYSVQRKVNVQNVGSRSGAGDTSGNLFLGQVGGDGTVGQFPFFELIAGAGTALDEFKVILEPSYMSTTGLEPVAGKNFVDLLVTLKPLSPGPKTATLSIYSNDANEPTVVIEITADAQQPPPCEFTTSPTEGDFGLVAPGAQKDLAFTITNNAVTAGQICIFSGMELGSGSDLAFSIVGGNIIEKELQPQQSFEVVVRVAPTGPTPTVLQTLTGQLVFNSTSPAKPQASIPLHASVGPSCITVTPDPLIFGTLKVGCSSSERSLHIYNTCNTPVTIKKLEVQAAAGQPAGGANCSSASACPEFTLVGQPTIPTGGLQLQPGGSAPVSLKVKYLPIDVGSDSGAIALDAIQNGQSITSLVGLKGNGDSRGVQIDTYAQEFKPKADILLVVDDSCSMENKQNSLGANFDSFITFAKSADVDYQIGVTTTTNQACDPTPFGCAASMSKGPSGRLVTDSITNLKFVTPATPALADVFARLVKVGIAGSALEQALATSVLALTPPLIGNENAGFLRPEASLAVVIVSDAADQSPEPVTYYQNLLVNVKGIERLSSFSFNTITPTLNSPPLNCTYDDTTANSSRFAPIVSFTSGVSEEICNTNWSIALQTLGKTAFGYRTQFFLNGTPDLAKQDIIVRINGVVTPNGPSTWEYEAVTNSVKFNPVATPAPGSSMDIEYVQACL